MVIVNFAQTLSTPRPRSCRPDAGLNLGLGRDHLRGREIDSCPQRGDLARGELQHLEYLYGQTQGDPNLEQDIQPRGAACGLARVKCAKPDDRVANGIQSAAA